MLLVVTAWTAAFLDRVDSSCTENQSAATGEPTLNYLTGERRRPKEVSQLANRSTTRRLSSTLTPVHRTAPTPKGLDAAEHPRMSSFRQTPHCAKAGPKGTRPPRRLRQLDAGPSVGSPASSGGRITLDATSSSKRLGVPFAFAPGGTISATTRP